MKITVQKEDPNLVAGLCEDADHPPGEIQTETIDLYELFYEYIEWVDKNYMNIRKIVMHSDTYRAMRKSKRFRQLCAYSPNDRGDGFEGLQFLGVNIEHEDLGFRGMTDFLIYTDERVIHSDMVEKDFIQDMDVEEALRETNDMIDERDP